MGGYSTSSHAKAGCPEIGHEASSPIIAMAIPRRDECDPATVSAFVVTEIRP